MNFKGAIKYIPRSVSACNFCTKINLFVCASFRVFFLNFDGDKLSPWPFFKGTIPIAVRDWCNGAAWLKPWMLQNLLKLNRSKTELLILNAKHRPSPPIAAVAIGDAVINPSKTAQNISAVCDSSLSVEEHVKASCKSAFFHLSNIAQIRKHLPTQAAETLIHSFVTSKVDFFNSLLYGVPNQLIRKLLTINLH